MTTVCILYQPGSFGSFVSWIVDRFSVERCKYEPAILDNPLKPNGSSHAYASFCKIKRNTDFMQALEDSRNDDNPWGYSIYAGWPAGVGEDINVAVAKTVEWMLPTDRAILIECVDDGEHCVRYLRNERQMDKDRWYGMMEIDNDSQLYDRLKFDIANTTVNSVDDSRVMRLGMTEILTSDPEVLYANIAAHLGWAVLDSALFTSTLEQMRMLQKPYADALITLHSKTELSPVELAIFKYLHGE